MPADCGTGLLRGPAVLGHGHHNLHDNDHSDLLALSASMSGRCAVPSHAQLRLLRGRDGTGVDRTSGRDRTALGVPPNVTGRVSADETVRVTCLQ